MSIEVTASAAPITVSASGTKIEANVSGGMGPPGSSASITVGTVTTGAPGSSASVVNAGSSSAAVLNFVIPAGQPGATGPQGAQGPAGTTSWNGITDRPSTFAPSAHQHAISEVVGLSAALDGKQAAGSYAASVHTHSASQITDFAAAVVAAAPPTTNASLLTSGTLDAARLPGSVVLTTDSRLSDARQPLTHQHTASQITDFTSAVIAAAPPTTNASLLTSGTISEQRIPNTIARTSDITAAVANVVNAAPAALDTLNELAAALGNDASFSATVTNALAAKAPLANPTFTGTVGGITKSMVGLGNVDNTADASKPVSAAQAAADAAVASAAAADATSKANAAQAAAVQRANHTGTQAISTVSGLQAALDAKASLAHSHGFLQDAGDLQTSAGSSTSGTIAIVGAAGLPSAGKLVAASQLFGLTVTALPANGLSVVYGTSALTACQGNDARLSDARTPTAHDQAWSTITSTPTTLAGYGITDAAAALHTHTVTDVTGAVATSDSRLTDARTPTGAAGGDLTGTYPNPTIAPGAVVTADLADGAVTTAKIADSAVTDAKVSAVAASKLTGTVAVARLPTVLEQTVTVGNSGTATTLSLANGSVQTVTLSGNCTFTMPTAAAGASLTLILTQGGTFTATFTSVLWAGGTAPTITATNTKRDILVFVSDGTSWFGTASQNH